MAGRGDARALGWVGRVVARTPQDDIRLTAFPLGVPGETTVDLAARWESETARRLGLGGRLVVAPGIGDLRDGVTTARSRLNVANVVDAAQSRGLPVLVVGPPPVLRDGPDGALAEQVAPLSHALADVCDRRRVPYVDTYAALDGHADWERDLAASDGRVPGQAGYGLLAYLVLHGGWFPWLGVVSPAPPSA